MEFAALLSYRTQNLRGWESSERIGNALALTRSSYALHVELVKLYMKPPWWCRRHIRFTAVLRCLFLLSFADLHETSAD